MGEEEGAVGPRAEPASNQASEKDATDTKSSMELEDEKELQTPPSSPTNGRNNRPSLFSLAQVSSKLGELWSTARESIFGEDYWIPTDPNEITLFPLELLRAHKVVFPTNDHRSLLRVVQGSFKNKPAEPLHHVVFSLTESPNSPAYSLFRAGAVEDAVDLCRRCLECYILFRLIERSTDAKKSIQDLMAKLRQYPLYRMIHIAIACDRQDLFTDANVEYLNTVNTPFESLMKIMVQPEGKYPLLLAIEMHRLKIVRRMLTLGADPLVKDINGNNAIHYASLASVQMLELLWEFEGCHVLLNQTNNEGYVPLMLAIRAANPRCFATLLNFGAELSMRVQGRNPLFEAMQSKGKNTDIIKAILEASPDLVAERDSSGNTALHVATHKTPLMGLLLLKCKDVDMNARNNAGQTPLHIFTHKGEIGLMITLLSYACDIDSQDNDGNTALHVAVSKRNLEATRLLLCLGADPNINNSHDDSPRHLAARLREKSILDALIKCGARTCGPSKVGCVSGCVNGAMVGLLKSSALSDSESPRSSSTALSAQDYPASVDVDHPIRDFTQKMFYEQLMERLEDLAARHEKPRNMVNLLSLDGGGIRGLVILQTLMAIERELGEPIFPFFDWVAGTSTGALIATALAQGRTLRECQHIYLRFKDLIFDGWTRPYNASVLEMFMKEAIGEKSLDDIKYPRLLISTVKADYFPVKLEFMRNYRLPLSDEENMELGFVDPADVPTWKALRRTSAAPMFFPPVDDKYIDGGIIANNPALDLLAEVQLYNGIHTYLISGFHAVYLEEYSYHPSPHTKQEREAAQAAISSCLYDPLMIHERRPENKVEIGCMLSLGTGQIPLSPLDPLHVEIMNPISSAFTFKNLSLILVDQVTATEGAPVDRSRSWCNAIGVPFFRLSAPLHKDIGLGTKDDHDIAHMMWDCVEYTHKHHAYILKICALLKRLGKTPVDRPLAVPISSVVMEIEQERKQ